MMSFVTNDIATLLILDILNENQVLQHEKNILFKISFHLVSIQHKLTSVSFLKIIRSFI